MGMERRREMSKRGDKMGRKVPTISTPETFWASSARHYFMKILCLLCSCNHLFLWELNKIQIPEIQIPDGLRSE